MFFFSLYSRTVFNSSYSVRFLFGRLGQACLMNTVRNEIVRHPGRHVLLLYFHISTARWRKQTAHPTCRLSADRPHLSAILFFFPCSNRAWLRAIVFFDDGARLILSFSQHGVGLHSSNNSSRLVSSWCSCTSRSVLQLQPLRRTTSI